MVGQAETDPLALEARKNLYELIRRHPGLHYRELERKSGMISGQLEYHLAYMEKAALIQTVSDGGFTRYYVAKARLTSQDKQIISYLRQELPRGLILYLILNAGSGHGDLAKHFSVSAPTISYHMKRMVDSGVILEQKTGRRKTYHVDQIERVVELLILFRPSFIDVIVDGFLDIWYSKQAKN